LLFQIPVIEEQTVDAYLAQFEKKLDEKAINMYQERFLLSARSVVQDNKVFVRARCFAEMKKSITYNVDVIVCQRGGVLEAQCECGAGLGPDAHCKHVICILYGLIQFTKVGDLMVQETCTERLQTFHKCKRYKGSPLKIKDVKLRKSHSQGRSISAMAAFDPRPQPLRNNIQYKSYFRNLVVAQSCAKSMPLSHLYPPANLYAINNDHDYDVLTPENTFLRSNHLSSITEEVQKQMEQATIGQSKVAVWYEVRSMRITSSHFGRVCKATERTDFDRLARELVSQTHFHSAATDHGLKYEPIAIKEFEKATGLLTKECGVFVSASHPYLCSTPDRLIDDDRIVEVKCPFSAKDRPISPVSVPFLEKTGGELTLSKTHNYYYQVQGQLFCTGRQMCLFVVYTLSDMKCISISRDADFIAAMISTLEHFYCSHFKRACLDKFFYKNYYTFNFDNI